MTMRKDFDTQIDMAIVSIMEGVATGGKLEMTLEDHDGNDREIEILIYDVRRKSDFLKRELAGLNAQDDPAAVSVDIDKLGYVKP